MTRMRLQAKEATHACTVPNILCIEEEQIHERRHDCAKEKLLIPLSFAYFRLEEEIHFNMPLVSTGHTEKGN